MPGGTPDAEAEAPGVAGAEVPDDRPGVEEAVACAPSAAEEVEAGVAEVPARRRKARLPSPWPLRRCRLLRR